MAKDNIRETIALIKVKLAEKNKADELKTDPDITRQGGKLAINITL